MSLLLWKLQKFFEGGGLTFDYYFHMVDLPIEMIIYERLGPQLYALIDQEIKQKQYWYHKYHSCETCGECHQCKCCNKCYIESHTDGHNCINCQYPIVSNFDEYEYKMSKSEIDDWRTQLRLYVNNQELLVLGVRKHVNILSKEIVESTERLSRKLQQSQKVKKTVDNKNSKKKVDKTNGKYKHFFNMSYKWQFKGTTNDRWKITGGARTDVEPIPWELQQGLINELEEKNVIAWNSVNAAAFNDYQKKIEGIGKHLDEATKIVLDEEITSLRLFNDARIRWGGSRFKKNAICSIPLNRNDVLKLLPWTVGKDYLKHSIANTDLLKESSSWILRQGYPFVLQMCHQTDNNP